MNRAQPIPAYIGLGANLGNRERALATALKRLDEVNGIEVLDISKYMENPAVGGPKDSPPFLNAVAKISTLLGSHALLQELMKVEKSLGRDRRVKWEPRSIDLDLLLYGSEIISSQELIVPHPLMHERLFVLKPLAEIAPDVVHPTLQMTIRGLLENLQNSESA